ncbi:MAG: AAA family ATPase [Chloroflexi bacterium]|nr:AAA family ATPase [Chloroflexota bacterium]
MTLIFIYGPPGVGKLTVARELVKLTGFKLFHNHLTVNAASPLFERGSAAWTKAIVGMRRVVFEQAAVAGVDIIYTAATHSTPASIELNRYQLEPVYAAGGRPLFVRLTCSLEELFRRVQYPERVAQDKLTDPTVLAELIEIRYSAYPLPFEPTLTIDSTALAPNEVAEQVARHYSLPFAPRT